MEHKIEDQRLVVLIESHRDSDVEKIILNALFKKHIPGLSVIITEYDDVTKHADDKYFYLHYAMLGVKKNRAHDIVELLKNLEKKILVSVLVPVEEKYDHIFYYNDPKVLIQKIKDLLS